MTIESVLDEIASHVEWCRDNGETDMRCVLYKIDTLRKEHAKELAKPRPTIAELQAILDGEAERTIVQNSDGSIEAIEASAKEL